MSQTLLEMTKDLGLAQIAARYVPADALGGVLQSTYATLRGLETAEASGGGDAAAGERLEAQASAVDWKSSITKNAIRCLECDEPFKQLSLRHLATHGLDPRSYRIKYNIPRSQALSARAVTARRRELAQRIRPWELAPSKTQNGVKAEAAATNGKAKPAGKAPAKAPAKAAATKGASRSRAKRAASGG